MLTPSYSDLMDKVNTDFEDSKITSRYTIVLAAAKRARQIIDGAVPLTYTPNDRAVSIAVKEMNEGRIRIHVEPDALDDSYERLLQSQSKLNISAVSQDGLREDLKDKYEPIVFSKDDEGDDDDYNDNFAGESSADEDSYLYDEKDDSDDSYNEDDEDSYE